MFIQNISGKKDKEDKGANFSTIIEAQVEGGGKSQYQGRSEDWSRYRGPCKKEFLCNKK